MNVTEMKYIINGIISRLDMAEEVNSDLEDISMEQKSKERKTENMARTEYTMTVVQLQKA